MSFKLYCSLYFELVFTAITCATLADPVNGAVLFDNTVDLSGNVPFETVATFMCDDEFGRIGAETRTCGGDGSSTTGLFDGTSPTCERELFRML